MPDDDTRAEPVEMKTIALVILCSGFTLLAVSVPLALRKVPMNRLWGIRIPAAFESQRRWYEVNAYGGKQFAAWSGPIILTGLVGLFLPPRFLLEYAWSATAISFLSVLVPVVQTCLWARRR